MLAQGAQQITALEVLCGMAFRIREPPGVRAAEEATEKLFPATGKARDFVDDHLACGEDRGVLDHVAKLPPLPGHA